ncbi:hypothetical protein AJ80_01402 [Polytolypa hystricis UAMH7299]|uniref:Zn(2)-C6 fungal-type domain-containing protein n=1 Tax=Polytolypa hystricis (strain UAMH7299) TaxID=1447883 RepID=A0A2B7Z0S1_POLH7|nr:hypothetical protein AJ80_01402 [Polytolypa hystricis UAMH7299]
MTFSPSPESSPSKEYSKTPCYTCRRRRVTCDKLLPACRKCHRAGKPCLGYKKPLTWVRGVASRGKMMGLTFDDVSGEQKHSSTLDQPKLQQQLGGYSNGDAGVSPPRERSRSFGQRFKNARAISSINGYQSHTEHVDWNRRSQDMHNQDLHVVQTSPRLLPALTDPVFQDMDELSRHYLTYYDRQFCWLMVLFETRNRNPYRRLLQMVGTSPALCAAIAAIGSCHNLQTLHYSRKSCFDKGTASRLPRSSLQDGDEQFIKSPDPMVRTVYQHVLMFKQRALYLLERSLSDPEQRGEETTIASALLLIILDLVESGRDGWKVHVEGAKRLIQSRLSNCDDGDSLSMFLTGNCMIFDIMGSTLAPSGTWTVPISTQLETTPPQLSASESDLFLGCPAYLLHLILFISSLRHANASSQTRAAQADVSTILSHIDAFDPEQWTLKLQSQVSEISDDSFFPDDSSSPSRIYSLFRPSNRNERPSFRDPYHLASAHKVAITIYATRVLLRPSVEEYSFADQVTQLITHISQIPRSSEIFKSILWPTFIAGIECRCPEQRAWIRDTVETLWLGCLTANIKAAVRVLDAIWDRENDGNVQGDWIEFLDRSNVSWLFV